MDVTEETKTTTAYEYEDRKASDVPGADAGFAIAATLQEAHAVPNPWAWGHVQLYLVCAIVYLCSTMNGYDGSLMGSINIMPEYQDYYHLGPNGSAGTGLVFSIFNIGQMIGALFTWCNDWRGRKFMVIFGCVGVVACAIFTATAPTLGSFIGARFLLSFFSTLASSAAPLLLVEVAPPLQRGAVAGGYNTLYYMGSIIATFTIYGCNLHLHGNIKWRLSLWLQAVCPGLVVLGAWFIPESPRWLIAKGRHEEARAFLVKHHANGDPNHPIVAVEMREIEESLSRGGIRAARDYFNIKALFKSRSRRYRMLLVISWSWFMQFSGNNVASYYLPTMIKAVGITSVPMAQLLNGIYAVTGWIAASIGARCHDVVGRRKMFLFSTGGMVICLAIITGATARYQIAHDVHASSAMIAFIFIFGVVFAVGYTPMQPVYSPEILANDMRANGVMVSSITSGCAGFVNTFAAPLAMQNITYWL
ncbi:general substrate transporter [Trichoderma chlorosporum]